MIEGIDYEFINPANDPTMVHIKLLNGEYKDTIFKFGKVHVEEKDGEGHLHFGFDIIESKTVKPRKLEKNNELRITLVIY